MIDRIFPLREAAEAHRYLEAGKQLELDAIVTAVVEMADLTGASAPTLRTIHAATDLLARTGASGESLVDRISEKATQPALH